MDRWELQLEKAIYTAEAVAGGCCSMMADSYGVQGNLPGDGHRPEQQVDPGYYDWERRKTGAQRGQGVGVAPLTAMSALGMAEKASNL